MQPYRRGLRNILVLNTRRLHTTPSGRGSETVAAPVDEGRRGRPSGERTCGYFALNSSQTAMPMAAGSRNSAQSCHTPAHAMGFRSVAGGSSRNDVDSLERRFDGKPRMARTISSLPLRSAIRMVAELIPLVDCSSFLRSEGGTPATDR